MLERARATNDHTTTQDAAWVEEILEKGRSALQEPLTSCLVMEDYQEGNVVFSRTSADWEISGVFDLMQCYFGDGEIDLSRTAATYLDEQPEVAREFLISYLRLSPPRRGFDQRFPVYMILDRLIIWEYVERQEPEVARRLGSLREWAGGHASMVESLGLSDASIGP
jgi:fructosamine-3-kinase